MSLYLNKTIIKNKNKKSTSSSRIKHKVGDNHGFKGQSKTSGSTGPSSPTSASQGCWGSGYQAGKEGSEPSALGTLQGKTQPTAQTSPDMFACLKTLHSR